jgi:hypothetical protein
VALIYQDQYLHRRYAKPGKIECLATHDRIVLDMLKKGSHSGSGKTFHEPVIVSNPQGLGSTLTAAQQVSEGGHAGSGAVVGEWSLPYGDYAGEVIISDKDIAAGGDVPDGSYLKPFGLQTDGLIDEFGEVMDSYLFAESGKALGQYTGASMAAGVLTLTGDAAETQIMNFNLGAAFQSGNASAATPSAASLLGAGSVGFVIAVDYDALTVTFSTTAGGAAATPAAWNTATPTNFLFRNSDFQGTGGGNTPTFIMDSFADWIPSVADTGTFKSLPRGSDTRLSGGRLTAAQSAGLNTEERIKKLVVKLNSVFGGKGEKLVCMESIQWQKLASILEKRGQRPLDGKTANMGYKYIELNTARGPAKVIAVPKCRPDMFWALEIDKWTLRTLNGFPAVMKSDGFQMLRKASSNTYGFRLTCYGHLSTPYPSRHGRGIVDVSA